MKAEELRGRELAAWIAGASQGFPDDSTVGQIAYFAIREIERLCAEPIVIHHPPTPEYFEKSRRDAAALDEIAELVRRRIIRYPDMDAIIERTGRKIGA